MRRLSRSSTNRSWKEGTFDRVLRQLPPLWCWRMAAKRAPFSPAGNQGPVGTKLMCHVLCDVDSSRGVVDGCHSHWAPAPPPPPQPWIDGFVTESWHWARRCGQGALRPASAVSHVASLALARPRRRPKPRFRRGRRPPPHSSGALRWGGGTPAPQRLTATPVATRARRPAAPQRPGWLLAHSARPSPTPPPPPCLRAFQPALPRSRLPHHPLPPPPLAPPQPSPLSCLPSPCPPIPSLPAFTRFRTRGRPACRLRRRPPASVCVARRVGSECARAASGGRSHARPGGDICAPCHIHALCASS